MNLGLPIGRRGQMLALALTALVLAAIWFGAVNPLREWYSQRTETLATRRELAIRMARLGASLPALQAAASVAAAPAAAVATLDGETDAIAAANLQQRVQALAAAEGATISSAEVLPVEREAPANAGPDNAAAGADRPVRLRVSFEANWPVLMQFIASIETGPPLMLIDDVHIEGGRALIRAPVQPMQASLTVTGFRRPEPGGP